MTATCVSRIPLVPAAPDVDGGIVDFDGERWFRVSGLDGMPPFFMSVVSDSDHWLFLSSNGALTAGRRDPDHALFPYHADDRIHDSLEHTGGKTLVRVAREGGACLWEPFSDRYQGLYRIRRDLLKSVRGNKIVFEERNEDLGLAFRVAWMTSHRFGFVRRSELVNLGSGRVEAEVLDGLQNVLPAGLGWRFQLEFSTLCDGYKRTELLADTGLALFRLSSIPADRPEPSEALRVNTAWSLGLDSPGHLLSSPGIAAFRRGEAPAEETDVRGRRGAYLVNGALALEPGASREWFVVADVALDAVAVVALRTRLAGGGDLRAELLEDIERGTRGLLERVAGADGLQAGEDERSASRHFSNTLFNIMRGGMPGLGTRIPRDDFRLFVSRSNRDLAARHGALLAALEEAPSRGAFTAALAATGDPDLERLGREYLPLTFSRRHGDPSRPWNIFSIQVREPGGAQIYNYQGNWRDIFQNWEALGFSYPTFLEAMIAKFLGGSTADGHNPYRVLREGFEWETLDPHDPWSFIGYWGDHQVVYLLRLMEASERTYPGALAPLLDRRIFGYADVPYRIKPFDELLADPHRTIEFDAEAHHRILARAEALGADGKLLQGPGGPVRAGLAEKLLVVALAKLSNFIPGAGIWMNTQRPEWNDANNALVGYGVSLVTLCHLRRFLAFCDGLLERDAPVAEEVAAWFGGIAAALASASPEAADTVSGRRALLEALGRAGSSYRKDLYARGRSGRLATIPASALRAFFAGALGHLDHAIRANRRDDGLYHAYNLMGLEEGDISIRRLQPMLEGQVAALSAGILAPAEAADLLDALRRSPLRREDVGSYLLYPDRELPRFLEKNLLPEDAPARIPLLGALVEAGDTSIVVRDVLGRLHFNADFRSRRPLEAALDALGGPAEACRGEVLALYEAVFDHRSFTGRSGTFYKYEGLGCVYWHMVSKLLLAADEARRATPPEDPAFPRLQRHCREIREGLGVHRSPAQVGAIPIDPYSHTPAQGGAQQPGMTGQVKEDFLSRFGDLGVQVEAGRIAFHPAWVPGEEFLTRRGAFTYVDLAGRTRTLDLEPGSLAYTLCQVPVVATRSGAPSLRALLTDGSCRTFPGLSLDLPTSRALFDRTGEIERIEVVLGS
ncbi:hypothetical protein [Mesoterricola silvestris]|uniref:Uncharacterized protein n=1 Tax=Mesoterricola silvestris TaxID=2927979 RepID=A0AA48GWZ8_9BACT|nr:hypothetical protein [Mesoterricola silvestris]BDU71878.1 hypothetical protein METEAL_10520 [Mesoterricola silvestris]